MIRRREFLAGVGASLVFSPAIVRAEAHFQNLKNRPENVRLAPIP